MRGTQAISWSNIIVKTTLTPNPTEIYLIQKSGGDWYFQYKVPILDSYICKNSCSLQYTQ